MLLERSRWIFLGIHTLTVCLGWRMTQNSNQRAFKCRRVFPSSFPFDFCFWLIDHHARKKRKLVGRLGSFVSCGCWRQGWIEGVEGLLYSAYIFQFNTISNVWKYVFSLHVFSLCGYFCSCFCLWPCVWRCVAWIYIYIAFTWRICSH